MRHAVLFALLVAGSVHAQPKPVTPDDYASVATPVEVAVSPDGKQVAYVLATWDEKSDRRVTAVWVVPTDGKGTPRKLTADAANDRHPKWAADGKSLYVVANRRKDGQREPPYNGSPQVWRLPAEGKAAPAPVTRAAGGVVHFDYAPKADEVFYTVDAEAAAEDAFAKLRDKFPKLDASPGKRKVSDVYRVRAGGKPEKLPGLDGRYVREFAATRDGQRLALVTAADDTVIRSEGDSRVDIWDADTGKVKTTDQSWKKTAGSPWPWLESVAWNPAGDRLAYCTIFDGHPAEVIVCEEKEGGWPAKRMPRLDGRIHLRGYGTPLRWMDRDIFYYFTDQDGVNDIRTWSLKDNGYGGDNVLVGPGAVVFAHDINPSNFASAAVRGDATGLGRVVGLADTGRVTLVDPNPQVKGWALPSVEHVTWTAPDGTKVGGVLELPPGYKKGDGKPLPLVVAIHGGPTTSSHAALDFDPHNGRMYLAAAGYAVLCPNYRGSTGYGDKFVTDLLGRENDLDVKDILAGIQHLIKEGIADADRVGVMGWSNGGYLTNCLISLKDPPVKFKAASSGASIVDTVAEWGFNDEPAYPRVLKTGQPWEKPDIYRKTSPTYQLANVTTPTLIHVGEKDERCPPGQSRMLYRALKEYVGVPAQLVVYPGEPHGLTKLSHRKAKMEWDLAWFDKYLKGK